MARYARGDDAVAIDDRSGFKVKHKDLRKEWTGVMVHKSEYEEKHPQLDPPKNVRDSQAIKNPRPDNDSDGTPVSQTLAAALLIRGDPVTHGDTAT